MGRAPASKMSATATLAPSRRTSRPRSSRPMSRCTTETRSEKPLAATTCASAGVVVLSYFNAVSCYSSHERASPCFLRFEIPIMRVALMRLYKAAASRQSCETKTGSLSKTGTHLARGVTHGRRCSARAWRAAATSGASRSQATTLAAPARAAISASNPVPVPRSSTCAAPSAAALRCTARAIAASYACACVSSRSQFPGSMAAWTGL